jgi:hypothetical protein
MNKEIKKGLLKNGLKRLAFSISGEFFLLVFLNIRLNINIMDEENNVVTTPAIIISEIAFQFILL